MIRKGFLALVCMAGIAVIVPTTSFADSGGAAGVGGAVAGKCKSGKILTLDPWYKDLMEDDCTIQSPAKQGMEKFIWTIVRNIVNDIFQIVGYIATGFIIYGGFLFMTSAGNPDQAARGRKTLINAIVGLVIAMSAGVIVNLIAGALIP